MRCRPAMTPLRSRAATRLRSVGVRSALLTCTHGPTRSSAVGYGCAGLVPLAVCYLLGRSKPTPSPRPNLPVAQATTGEGLLSPQVLHPLQANTPTPESNNSVSTTPVRTAVTARNIESARVQTPKFPIKRCPRDKWDSGISGISGTAGVLHACSSESHPLRTPTVPDASAPVCTTCLRCLPRWTHPIICSSR